MGMLLRVQVISGSGYDSTTQTNLATSSTSASTVSRGVLIKGAARRKRKWENLPLLPWERHETCQTPLAGAAASLQGHSMAFSPAQKCFAHPPCVHHNRDPSAFAAAAFCCLLQVLHFPLCSLYSVQNGATQAWGSSNKSNVSLLSNPPLPQGAQHQVAYGEDRGKAVPLLRGWHWMGWKCKEQHTHWSQADLPLEWAQCFLINA